MTANDNLESTLERRLFLDMPQISQSITGFRYFSKRHHYRHVLLKYHRRDRKTSAERRPPPFLFRPCRLHAGREAHLIDLKLQY